MLSTQGREASCMTKPQRSAIARTESRSAVDRHKSSCSQIGYLADAPWRSLDGASNWNAPTEIEPSWTRWRLLCPGFHGGDRAGFRQLADSCDDAIRTPSGCTFRGSNAYVDGCERSPDTRREHSLGQSRYATVFSQKHVCGLHLPQNDSNSIVALSWQPATDLMEGTGPDCWARSVNAHDEN